MASGQLAGIMFIYAAWLVWVAIWVVMARHTKPVVRRESLMARASHLVPLGVAALLLASPRLAGSLLEQPIVPRAGFMVFAGGAIVLAGLGFAVWARVVLAGNWSGTVTVKAAHELVRRGPYRLARHPIYSGLITALFGTMVAIDAWRALVALVIITASFVHKMRREEAFMLAQFGTDYDVYRSEVAALVPFLI